MKSLKRVTRFLATLTAFLLLITFLRELSGEGIEDPSLRYSLMGFQGLLFWFQQLPEEELRLTGFCKSGPLCFVTGSSTGVAFRQATGTR